MTMFSDSMMTWLTPTISASRAEGISTRQVSCRRVAADHVAKIAQFRRHAAQRQLRDPGHWRHRVDQCGDDGGGRPEPETGSAPETR